MVWDVVWPMMKKSERGKGEGFDLQSGVESRVLLHVLVTCWCLYARESLNVCIMCISQMHVLFVCAHVFLCSAPCQPGEWSVAPHL